jgi:hypothetical protein
MDKMDKHGIDKEYKFLLKVNLIFRHLVFKRKHGISPVRAHLLLTTTTTTTTTTTMKACAFPASTTCISS